MAALTRMFLACAVLVELPACHKAPPPAIDPRLLSSVPADTTVLAGLDLERLRASRLYQKIPASVTPLLQPFHDCRYLLLTLRESGYLILGQGSFREAPPGATLLAPGLMAAGSSEAIQAATAQFRSGRAAVNTLFEPAGQLAAANEVWIVADGRTTLPLTGNAENLNRLIHYTQHAAVAVHLGDGIQADFTGLCSNPENARELEESLRAFVTLAVAGVGTQSPLAARLRSIQVTRDDRTVHAGFSADAAGVDEWLALLR
jgi:hypothetical protein